MKDIARAAGVSQTTVSFVLNENRDVLISDETRERVINMAKDLGYELRSINSGHFVDPKAPFIGFLIDEIATSVFASLSIDEAQQRAWDSGYLLQLATSHNDKVYEEDVLSRWIAEGVTGVVYGSILTRKVNPPSILKQINTVLLNCYTDDYSYPTLLPAEIMGGFSATECLIEAGCKRIAYINGEEWMEAAAERLQGYKNALSSYGLEYDDQIVKPGNFMPSGGYTATMELLSQDIRPDGIFCANDLMAIGAYEAIKEAGLDIPGDIRIVGYDDHELASHLNPPLSTISLPHREMGQFAIDELLTTQRAQKRKLRTIRLECPLVERKSAR